MSVTPVLTAVSKTATTTLGATSAPATPGTGSARMAVAVMVSASTSLGSRQSQGLRELVPLLLIYLFLV